MFQLNKHDVALLVSSPASCLGRLMQAMDKEIPWDSIRPALARGTEDLGKLVDGWPQKPSPSVEAPADASPR